MESNRVLLHLFIFGSLCVMVSRGRISLCSRNRGYQNGTNLYTKLGQPVSLLINVCFGVYEKVYEYVRISRKQRNTRWYPSQDDPSTFYVLMSEYSSEALVNVTLRRTDASDVNSQLSVLVKVIKRDSGQSTSGLTFTFSLAASEEPSTLKPKVTTELTSNTTPRTSQNLTKRIYLDSTERKHANSGKPSTKKAKETTKLSSSITLRTSSKPTKRHDFDTTERKQINSVIVTEPFQVEGSKPDKLTKPDFKTLYIGVSVGVFVVVAFLIAGIIVYRRKARRRGPFIESKQTGKSGDNIGQGEVSSPPVTYAYVGDTQTVNSTDVAPTSNNEHIKLVQSNVNEQLNLTDQVQDSDRVISEEGLVYVTVVHTDKSERAKLKKTGPEDRVEYTTIDFDRSAQLLVTDKFNWRENSKKHDKEKITNIVV